MSTSITYEFTDAQAELILDYLRAASAQMPFYGPPEETPEPPTVQDFVNAAIGSAMLSVTNWAAHRPETRDASR